MLDNTPNQLFKFRTKVFVEINDDSHGVYNTNNQIILKCTIIKSSLCDYSDAYILVKGTTVITGGPAAGNAAKKEANKGNKGVILKNCAPFSDCISRINNTQVDNAKELKVLMPIYNLIEYSNNYSKTSESLWQLQRWIRWARWNCYNIFWIIPGNGKSNRKYPWKWLHKGCWNRSTIKIFK